MIRKYIISVFFVLIGNIVLAQTGGTAVYSFLNMPVSAKVAALGNKVNALRDYKDPSIAILNPSLLNKQMHTGIGINCVHYFADDVYGHLNYIHDFKKVGTFNFAFQYAIFGKIDSYDELGMPIGTFSAGDYALCVGYGREMVDSMFSLGMNIKTIFSDYANYFSSGIAVDFAASYYNLPKEISLSLLIKNVGAQFNTYDGVREKLPFDLQLSFVQRLLHSPIRYHIILHHLYKWDMSYTDTKDPFVLINETGNASKGKGKRFFNNLFQHFIIGVEILPIKYFSLQASFDYNTRYQMRTYDKKGFVGFSYGLGLHFYNFNIHYARSHNNLVSVPNYFTISTNIGAFIKK